MRHPTALAREGTAQVASNFSRRRFGRFPELHEKATAVTFEWRRVGRALTEHFHCSLPFPLVSLRVDSYRACDSKQHRESSRDPAAISVTHAVHKRASVGFASCAQFLQLAETAPAPAPAPVLDLHKEKSLGPASCRSSIAQGKHAWYLGPRDGLTVVRIYL